jgi:outer membrane receptor for ferrienterochelin and colicins
MLLLASALPTAAQHGSDSLAVAIDEVVVTGTGTEHYFKQAPVQTEVISSRMLRSYSGRSLGDILTGLSPSFDISQGDMGAGVSMGGLGNAYMLILVNGKRLHGDLGGQNDLGLINPDDIVRIEIVKGASSSLYGSDAIAGVVNIITRRHRDIPLVVESTTRIGSHFDLQQLGTVAFTIGKLTSTTKFSLQHSDGWQNTTREWYRDHLWENSTTQTVSAFTNERVDQEFAWNLSERWEVTASGFYYRKLLVHRAGAPRWRAFNPLYHDQGYNLSARFKPTVRTTLTFDGSLDRHHYLYDYYNRYIDEYYRPDIVDGEPVRVPIHTVYFPGDRSSESDQRRLTLHGKGVFRLSEKHTLSTGVEWIRDALIAPQRMETDRASTYTLAIYGQDEWNISPKLNVTAGLRVVNHRSFGWTATPKVSALYKPHTRWNLRATYSRGFKAPTVKELHYFYERAMMGKLRLYIGNTALRPETSHYFSLGPEYHGKNFSISLTGSYNRVGGMIALVAVPIPAEYVSDEGSEYDGAMQYVNMEEARLAEAEMTFSWRPGAGFSLGGGYSLLHTTANLVDAEASDEAGYTIIERRPVDGSANHRANLRFGWRHDWKRYGLDIGLFGRGQTERYYKEYGNAPGYILWRLNTTHRVIDSERWSLELSTGIDNIFNHRELHPYGYNYGTTTAGRTFFGAASVRFGKKKQH